MTQEVKKWMQHMQLWAGGNKALLPGTTWPKFSCNTANKYKQETERKSILKNIIQK